MTNHLLQQAIAHHEAGRLPEAEGLYRQILQATPDQPVAMHLLGVIAYQVGQYELALQLIDRAIELEPDYAEAFNNRGGVLHVLRRYQAAVESYDKAILLKPDYAEAYNNRGNALRALGQYQAALENCERAIALKPDYAEAYSNRGNALHAVLQYEAALESCNKALQLKPEFADALINRGNALHALQRYQAAVESYDEGIRLNPQQAEAYNNRGSALHALQQSDAALENYGKAILLKPDYAEAYCNRAHVLQATKQYLAALEGYDKALILQPGYEYLPGMKLHMRRFLCDWDGIEDDCQQLEASIHRSEKAALPFTILAINDSVALQRKAAEIYVQDKCPPRPTVVAIPPRTRRDRIRIGYFSADYYNHATSYLMAELFEQHDRNKFEVLGFSFGPDTTDEMSARVSAGMDRFLDVRAMTDHDVAQLSRELEVDIAIDLKGFTRDSRPGIFAERPAPIQVSYLGYPGTMGAEYMDYLIADPTLIPEASRQYYSEKIAYLPDSYQANDSRRPLSDKLRARADEGLPEEAFVYCCFNNTYKITPEVFDIWMRILARIEGSVLWLLEDNPWVGDNLRKVATRRGIAAERLIFAKPLPLAEHLARQSLADLFLDTIPYNAHTTASDALWAGLPVLTRMGESFASRVAASLLRAVNLPELITATEAEYEELAVELARDAKRHQALRQRLQQGRSSASLFNSQAFTRNLEAAYSAMYERYHTGLPPEHIQIPPTC